MTVESGRIAGHQRERLVRGWEICSAPAGSLADPSELADARTLSWIGAERLGTVAAILRDAGMWSLDAAARRFDADDWWYRTHFNTPALENGDGLFLGFEGLATLADVWLNGEPLFSSDNMFVAHEQNVRSRVRSGRNELILRFRSLDTALQAKRPRPAWRAPMIENQQLRWHRTTVLGRTPGWSPPAAPVGCWKDVWVEKRSLIDLSALRVTSTVEGGKGQVHASASLGGRGGKHIDAVTLEVVRGGAAHRAELSQKPDHAFDGVLTIDQASLWWPHTHGEPALYEARLIVTLSDCGEPVVVEIGRIGFRSVEVDRSNDKFSVRINGVPIFCRGACWTPLDVVSLQAVPDAHAHAIEQVRDAGMNMLRLSGTTVYEQDAFFDACDELGVMVWQDFMFANMDYPAEPAFVASVEQEVRQQLARWQARPSLTVLCGNSEVEQQAAMWGAPRARWTPALFHEHIAHWVRDVLPAVPYWPSSAHGGAFPFQGDSGTTSYYGVGAYLRPLEDAHRADVRFATECLAFANLPDAGTIARMPGGESLRVTHPAWKARTPRDLGAGWDFEDVRDHYLSAVFGVDASALRYSNHERYLELGRVVTGEVMAATFAEWRRADSNCGGALVWFLRDLWAGAGWGLLDDAGVPKAAMHGLKRALQPVNVSITDEGCNGLFVHIVNERATALAATLHLRAFNEFSVPVVQATHSPEVGARAAICLPAAQFFDGFLDLSGAYRFGPPPAQVVVASLHDAAGKLLSECFRFPGGHPSRLQDDVGLNAAVTGASDRGFELTIRTERFAQNVFIDLPGFAPEDNHFHLAPQDVRTVRLFRQGKAPGRRGSVRALNAARVAHFEALG